MKQIPTTQSTGILAYIDRFTEKIENGIMSFGLLAISAIVFANVIARYFFGYSFAWSEELSRYIIVWVTFFGISSCARYDGHDSVDLLPNLLKGTAKRIQQIMVCLLSICLSIYMTFISVQFTLTQFEGGNTSISIAIPIWVIYLSTCIGFFLMSYVYVRKLAGMLKKTGGRNNEGEDKVC